jgi:hypothetical protein
VESIKLSVWLEKLSGLVDTMSIVNDRQIELRVKSFYLSLIVTDPSNRVNLLTNVMFHLVRTTEQSRFACLTLFMYIICVPHFPIGRRKKASIILVSYCVTGVVIDEPDHRP